VDFSTDADQDTFNSATIGALQRGQGQVDIPIQAITELVADWCERGLIVSDQNVRSVSSDFVHHLPDTLSVGDLSQNNVGLRGSLQRSRSFYVKNGADKKVVDKVVIKSELPGHPKLADGRALAAVDCARAGSFLPTPDKCHESQSVFSLPRVEGHGPGKIVSQGSGANAGYVHLDREIQIREAMTKYARKMDLLQAELSSISSQSAVCDALAKLFHSSPAPATGPP